MIKIEKYGRAYVQDKILNFKTKIYRLLTTKITAIAVINYNLVKVQNSYFVYKNT